MEESAKDKRRSMEVEELIFLHVCCIRGDGGKPTPKGVARYLYLALLFLKGFSSNTSAATPPPHPESSPCCPQPPLKAPVQVHARFVLVHPCFLLNQPQPRGPSRARPR